MRCRRRWRGVWTCWGQVDGINLCLPQGYLFIPHLYSISCIQVLERKKTKKEKKKNGLCGNRTHDLLQVTCEAGALPLC